MAELNHTAFKLSCTWVKVLAACEQITSKFEKIEQISNLSYQGVNRADNIEIQTVDSWIQTAKIGFKAVQW